MVIDESGSASVSSRIQRLYAAGSERRGWSPKDSRTARLFAAGRDKVAKKLGEEATEVVIEAIKGDHDAVVSESVDLIYHLVMVWVELGVAPKDIWKEMDRREAERGIAEKI